MSEDDRLVPDVAESGAAGPVGTDPERARIIADFKTRRAQYQAERSTAEPDGKRKTIDALASAYRILQATVTSNCDEAAPDPAPEFKLPEHLAAARARVDAAGTAPDVAARITAADAKEADDRRKREEAARSAEHTDSPPAAETETTGTSDRGGSGRGRRRGAARRGRRAPKKQAQPERTPEERNAAGPQERRRGPGRIAGLCRRCRLEHGLIRDLIRWDWNRTGTYPTDIRSGVTDEP